MKTVIQFSFLFLLVLFTACSEGESIPSEGSGNDDLEGPISRPTSGYGKDGDFEVAEIDFSSPEYAGKEVAIFYPQRYHNTSPHHFLCPRLWRREQSIMARNLPVYCKKRIHRSICALPNVGCQYRRPVQCIVDQLSGSR